ncbi:hypothetical protein G6F68_021414 [Rhizopus microsporus]|nr:hypothetical protein G6F68_021414 [Rhizopus microsporus]
MSTLPLSPSVARTIDLIVFSSGRPSSLATSSHLAAPGVGTSAMAWFDVGGVVGLGVVDQQVFAGVGDHLEFMAAGAAD